MKWMLTTFLCLAVFAACGGTDEAATDTTTPEDVVQNEEAVAETMAETVTPEVAVEVAPEVAAEVAVEVTPEVAAEVAAEVAVEVVEEVVQDVSTVPAGHTDNQQGVMHHTGKEDPLKNCVSCHGGKLKGGVGPSCYTCHNAHDHTVSHGGVMHGPGSTTTCKNCHGPAPSGAKSSTGGLGPACSQCH